MPRVIVGCTEVEANRVRPLALAAYDEARARSWPFLSDVLERVLRPAAENDRACVTAVLHALAKYDRLLAFATGSENGGVRLDALLALARGDVAHLEARLERIEHPSERRGVAFSFPDWIVDLVRDELGEGSIERALGRMNELAPRVVRANALKSTREACERALIEEGIEARPCGHGPHAIVLGGQRSPFRSTAFARGDFELQDEASQLVADVVAPPPRSLVVDACAGAGGKTLALAAMLEGRGHVVAIDDSEDKLAELRRRARRAGASNVRAIAVDLLAPGDAMRDLAGRAARVLLDAPCSGLGAIRRNPEARWRLRRADLTRLGDVQKALTRAAATLVAPHGRLVYATCSFLPSEGEGVVGPFLADHTNFSPVTVREILGRTRSADLATGDGRYFLTWRFDADRDGGSAGMDGFFAAVFRRKAPQA